MENFFEDYETLGLPGGPNELKRFTNGFIISERGQWDYPGQPTAVPTPSGRITMEGVEDNLLGIDNLGNTQYMTPGNEYQFEGDMVYEIPQAKKGGSKKKASKKYSRSLMAKNRLFAKNLLFEKKKSAKNKIFDPNSPYFQGGGITAEPYSEDVNWLGEKYKDLGTDLYKGKGKFSVGVGNYFPQNTFQKTELFNPYVNVGYNFKNNSNLSLEASPGNLGLTFRKSFQPGGETDLPQNVGISYLPEDGRSYYDPLSDTINLNPNASDAELNHELVHAWQNRTGRLRSNPNLPQQRPPIVASDDQAASYYTRKGDEVDQYLSNLKNIYPEMTGNNWTEDLDRFIPDQIKYDKAVEPLMYEDPNTMEGEAEYLSQTRGRPGGIGFRQDGGFIAELDDNEIEEYRKGGYIVEDISVPSLTKASYGHSVGNLIRKQEGGSISGTQGLTTDFSQRLTQFILDAKAQGIDLGIGSGYRSYEKQKRLWEQALKKYGSAEKARKWVAPPGGSFHNKGLAVDLNSNGQFLGKEANSKATEWAHANAKKYGLHFRMGHEPWHIEPIEKTKSSSGHDHVHDDDVIVDKYGDQPKPTTEEEYNKMIELKNLEFEAKQKELEERERALHDDDYSKWKPAKKEVVDERQQVLDAYSQIIAPSSKNVFEQYATNLQGQMKNGGLIMELDDYQIQKYLEGGYIIEDID